MTSPRRPWFHGLALILGALLVGVAGLRHPLLTGDGAHQLGHIADMPAWRTIHWSMAFGYVLVVGGLIGVLSLHLGTRGAGAARTGIFLSLFGYVVSLSGMLFMLGAGSALAAAFRTGEPGMSATHAAFAFDMLHPTARAALKIGAFGVSLGLYSLGWGVVSAGVLPRWLGWFGVLGGIVGGVVAVVLSEASPHVVGGVAIATVWQLAAGVLLLVRSPEAGAPASATSRSP